MLNWKEKFSFKETFSESPPAGLKWRSSSLLISSCVFLGILTDLSAYGIAVPVIPFRLQVLGYDESSVGSLTGWLVASYAAGLIISSPFAAYLGATFTSRRGLLITSILFMAAATVLFMESKDYVTLIIARFLQGISGTMIWSIGLSLMADSIPEKRIGKVLGFVLLGMTVGNLLGPVLGGVLYARLGFKAPFVFTLILLLVDLIFRVAVVEKRIALHYIRNGSIKIQNFEAPGYEVGEDGNEIIDEKESSKPTVKFSTKELFLSWYGMITTARSLTLLLITFINGFIIGCVLDTGLTIYLNSQYGLDSLGAGLVFIATVAPAFLASPLSGYLSDKYTAKYPILFGLIVTILGVLLLLIPSSLPLFVFFLVIAGFGLSFAVTPIVADLSIFAALEENLDASSVFSAFNMAFSIGTFVGPIAGGQLLGKIPIVRAWQAMIAMVAVMLFLCIVPTYLYVGGNRVKQVDLIVEQQHQDEKEEAQSR